MNRPPHDDGGAAFPFDLSMSTGSDNGPVLTDVAAHQGISFADLIAALYATQPSTESSITLAQQGYAIADALIAFKRNRDKAVSDYWSKQREKVRDMEAQAAKERAAAASQPSNG